MDNTLLCNEKELLLLASADRHGMMIIENEGIVRIIQS